VCVTEGRRRSLGTLLSAYATVPEVVVVACFTLDHTPPRCFTTMPPRFKEEDDAADSDRDFADVDEGQEDELDELQDDSVPAAHADASATSDSLFVSLLNTSDAIHT
jgi:hypothetical protein